MTIRTFLGAILLALPMYPAFCQSTPVFEVADVHVAARTLQPFTHPAVLIGERYAIKDATMVDLIAAAYGVDPANVQGGPIWLERDRFDVIAKTRTNTSKEDQKLMLRAVLADRFKLVTHTGSKPMPAYVLSVEKAGSKLKATVDDTAPGACEFKGQPPAPGAPFVLVFSCHNMTMESFAQQLHDWANGYLTQPVVDSTGLKGGFDFDIHWTNRGDLAKAGPDGISIFDAVQKQLGLKLELLTAPRPVILVDSVNEKPTANVPDVEKKLPPPPPQVFDVATIKPSAPDAKLNGRITGTQVNLQGVSLKFLISYAWDLNPNDTEVPVNAPKWLDTDKIDILAKVAMDPSVKTAPLIDPDDLRLMLRALLIERFQMKVHMEDRPVNSYQLVAAGPKMKKADPTERTVCKEGPGPDGRDPRTTNPILGRLVWCQNITMTQFADELQRIAAGFVYGPVLDATGIEGAYDFTLSFSSAGQVKSSDASAAAGTPSDPNGALSLFDALPKELGLKLEKQKRPMPVLVIDHVEEKPTEN